MPKPIICVSITETDAAKAIETICQLEWYRPDLIEIRLDHMSPPYYLDDIRKTASKKLVATNRRRDQGGISKEAEPARIRSLLEACDAGFDYIDISLNTPSLEGLSAEIKDRGADLILSHHNFNETPTQRRLQEIIEEEIALGADICKIVGTARTYSDNLTYLEALASSEVDGLVAFAMGRIGTPSRVLSPLMGGRFTYASAYRGREAAPGQLSLEEMIEIYRLMGVSV